MDLLFGLVFSMRKKRKKEKKRSISSELFGFCSIFRSEKSYNYARVCVAGFYPDCATREKAHLGVQKTIILWRPAQASPGLMGYF
jgi:hypothetical protein